MQNDPKAIRELLISLKKALARGEISIDEINESKNFSAVIAGNNKLREFLGITSQDKPVISIDANNWFGNVTFAHKANIYHTEEIVALESNQFVQTISFVPLHFSGFNVTISGGNVFKYEASSVLIRTKKVGKLNEAFDFISKKTFTQRLQQYVSQIETKGFFQYYDYFIYGNGDIKHKTKTVNIAESGLHNDVEFGRKSSFGLNSYYTPDEIWIYQRKIHSKFLKQRICINIRENRDVIYAILIKLAQLKGGKVTFAK